MWQGSPILILGCRVQHKLIRSWLYPFYLYNSQINGQINLGDVRANHICPNLDLWVNKSPLHFHILINFEITLNYLRFVFKLINQLINARHFYACTTLGRGFDF
ncbi:hypothetical protein [Moraxella lacunata]|uniref:hypothetical protein n=1 Tax=Moraxella lacunata TaxID=477 RepID=UPI003EE4121C